MDLTKEINEKYLTLEAEVDSKLEKIKRQEIKFEKCNAKEKLQKSPSEKIFNYDEAMARNANLLKSLEMTKARLRSRSTFSPVEKILEKALCNYKLDLDFLQNDETIRELQQCNENIYDTAL